MQTLTDDLKDRIKNDPFRYGHVLVVLLDASDPSHPVLHTACTGLTLLEAVKQAEKEHLVHNEDGEADPDDQPQVVTLFVAASPIMEPGSIPAHNPKL